MSLMDQGEYHLHKQEQTKTKGEAAREASLDPCAFRACLYKCIQSLIRAMDIANKARQLPQVPADDEEVSVAWTARVRFSRMS